MAMNTRTFHHLVVGCLQYSAKLTGRWDGLYFVPDMMLIQLVSEECKVSLSSAFLFKFKSSKLWTL